MKEKNFIQNPIFQISAISFIAFSFLYFDFYVYKTFTSRLINPFGKQMQVKSIELADYLPFDAHSKTVKVEIPQAEKFSAIQELPVLDGATALLPVYSAFFHSLYPEETCIFDGTDFTSKSLLQKRNTAGAFKAIVEKKADIIFCAEPSKKQLEYAKQNGVELVLVPIGYEAFIFLVNKDNPVSDLSVEQVHNIFSGKYKRWSEVGGDKSKISALVREEGSGSQTAMLAFMGGTVIKPANNAFAGRSIGYSFRFYVQGIVNDSNLKMLSLNGVEPTKENIRNKSYPIFSNFYAIYRASDADRKDIQKVVDFALSEKGQQIVEASGYVSLN